MGRSPGQYEDTVTKVGGPLAGTQPIKKNTTKRQPEPKIVAVGILSGTDQPPNPSKKVPEQNPGTGVEVGRAR